MALQIPDILKNPSRMNIGVQKNTNVIQSAFNRSKQVVENVGGVWQFSATWDILRPDQIPPMRAFLTAISGGTESFFFSDVSAPMPQIDVSGDFTVLSVPNIKTVQVSTPYVSRKVFSAGDYISIPILGGDYEYKMILNDVLADESGNANIEVSPVIRGNVAIGGLLVYENPVGEFITSDDFSGWGLESPIISTGVTINGIEWS